MVKTPKAAIAAFQSEKEWEFLQYFLKREHTHEIELFYPLMCSNRQQREVALEKICQLYSYVRYYINFVTQLSDSLSSQHREVIAKCKKQPTFIESFLLM